MYQKERARERERKRKGHDTTKNRGKKRTKRRDERKGEGDADSLLDREREALGQKGGRDEHRERERKGGKGSCVLFLNSRGTLSEHS